MQAKLHATLGHQDVEGVPMPVRVTIKKPKLLLLVAVPLVLLAGTVAVVFLRTERTLERARTAADERHKVGFEIRRLDQPEVRPQGVAFEPVAMAASFAAGAFFHGNFYLAGPAGLYVYAANSSASKDGIAAADGAELLHTYRVGADLPAAPLGPMAVGTLRGEKEPVLLVATAGEGILLFSPPAQPGGSGSFRQLRPDAAEMRDITALLPLATGDLLVGTKRAGLLIYSGTTLTPFRPETASVPVTALANDGAGGFWIGTRDRGALHWSGGTIEAVDTKAGLPDDQVESLLVHGENIFVGTPVGVAEVRNGQVVRHLAEGSFAHTLALTGNEKILAVGTMDEGALEVPLAARGTRRGISMGDRSNSQDAVASLLSLDGSMYAVLRNEVQRKRTSGGWETIVRAPQGTLADGNISALAFAPDGRLWVGYFDHGVDVLSAGTLDGGDATSLAAGRKTDHIEDDAVFCVNRLMVDPRRKTMVAATANGLVLFDATGRERQVLTRHDGLIADHVTDVAATRRGLAVATPAGLTFVDADGTASVYGFEGLVNNHVYALGVQPDSDELLAGTLGGVSLLTEESVRRNLTVANSGLRHNWVTAVVPMPDGGWMVGTYGAGVMRLDKDGHFAPMEGATRAMVVNPNAMLATPDHVFAGTLGQGLWVYTRATARWTQWTHGLPSQNVTAAVERNGSIYIGTENGLARIPERSLDAGGAR
jgi:ligand-binding sensor domain-containing protein